MSRAGALHQAGHLPEAEASYRHVLAVNPRNADALHGLGVVCYQLRRLDEARDIIKRAIAIKPDVAAYHNTLGLVFDAMQQLEAAIVAYHAAIRLNPDNAHLHYNLGLTEIRKNQPKTAIDSFRQAIKYRPIFPEAHNMLGVALMNAGSLDDAVASFQRAIELNPAYADARNNLGNALKLQAKLPEAIAAFRQAMSIAPHDPQIHSNLINTLLFESTCTGEMMLVEARDWQSRHAGTISRTVLPSSSSPSIDGRIRVGYVSPDFREHCQRFFMLPLLRNHDRTRFHITCYSNVALEDSATADHRAHADVWRDISRMDDQAAAELIRTDQIDILVDLTLHMAGNRLLIFARKPAPVQVTWLGYPGTTGLEAIDYRITDGLIDPPGLNDRFYAEKTVTLPHSFWCYDPQNSIPVNPLPASLNGIVTFGSLNNFAKINGLTLNLWTAVLREVEESRMIILADDGSHREGVLKVFEKAGVDPHRISFEPRCGTARYFELYNKVDISLDTFPCNGHTTTLDSIWMGVPVVSLAGDTAVSRGGLSILSNLGRPELAVHCESDYVQRATELAKDISRLAQLRQSLRKQLQQSPLMDGAAFARDMESIFRQVRSKSI